ncbi:MAG: hypothetical protein Q7S21_03865 [archaeon]|nr:hypothetical protein [archaeon]
MNLLKNLILGIILISLISIVNATIIPEKTSISMQNGKSATILVELKNNSAQNIEAQLLTRTNSNDIKAEFAQSTIFLNAYQQTQIAVNISSETDAEGAYNVEVKMKYDNIEDSANIAVNVYQDSTQGIALIAFPKNVCINQSDVISIQVQNNTGRFQNISLFADSELFLPTITPPNLELGPGETEFIEMKIQSNNTFKEGKYSVNVFAQTENQTVQATANFTLIECVKEPEKLFELKVSSTCLEIQKNKTSTISYTLTNLTDKEQEINIRVLSDIINFIPDKKVFLEPREQQSFELELEPRDETETGRHNVSIFAFNDKFDATENACVIVKAQRKTSVKLIKNNLEIERGSSETFEIKLTNNGDQSEKFTIRTSNISSDIKVKSSAASIVVAKNSSKSVFINVYSTLNAPLGSKKTSVIIQSDKTKEITLNFTIKEEIKRIEQNFIELISFPSQIEIAQNNDKAFSFTIENISGKDLENLKARLEGFPESINMSTLTIDSLAQNEKKTITAQIFVEGITADTYNGYLSFENNEFKQKFPIEIKITRKIGATSGTTNNGNNEIAGLLAGFASFFGGSITIGLLALIIILLILIVLVSTSEKIIARKYNYWWGK